ncbi:MAG: hypothetical protein O7F69_12645, partial [Alphaproteobacteria bacterium]|nr:hypothetical protein [Alphaproteobacteria bacterium]
FLERSEIEGDVGQGSGQDAARRTARQIGLESVAIFDAAGKLVDKLALYTVFYNFCRIRKSLRVTPAMDAGLSDTVRDMEWICELIDVRTPKLGRRGPYKIRFSN